FSPPGSVEQPCESLRLRRCLQRLLHGRRVAGDSLEIGLRRLVRFHPALLPIAQRADWYLKTRREFFLRQPESRRSVFARDTLRAACHSAGVMGFASGSEAAAAEISASVIGRMGVSGNGRSEPSSKTSTTVARYVMTSLNRGGRPKRAKTHGSVLHAM